MKYPNPTPIRLQNVMIIVECHSTTEACVFNWVSSHVQIP